MILDVLEEAGGDITHTVLSHLDRTFFDDAALLNCAKRGCYMEFDMFGIETSHYSVSNTDGDFEYKLQNMFLLVPQHNRYP